MADTKHHVPAHGIQHTEGDGISYKGLAWSMIALTIVTLFCYALVVGFFKFMESRAIENDAVRAPLAAPASQPAIESGRVIGGPASGPALLVEEPVNLQKFRADEEHQLTTYGWVDQNSGLVRLPIDRAKALLLERGISIREGAPAAAIKHEAPKAAETAKPAAPKAGGHK